MWSNIIPPETAAFGKRLTSALEQTGDVITKRAQAAAQAHIKHERKGLQSTRSSTENYKERLSKIKQQFAKLQKRRQLDPNISMDTLVTNDILSDAFLCMQ